MRKWLKTLTIFGTIGVWAYSIQAEPSKNFKVFLCFGQSNMTGGSGVNAEQIDKTTHPRVKVLAFNTSNCEGVSRTKDQWYDASEPMHCGDGANAMGPSYAFGRAMADSLPGDTIGLIPCGQWGVSIDFFRKGSSYSGTKPGYPGGNNVYNWMLNRCKKATERGVFAGIIMHQGESNTGDGLSWVSKVKSIVSDLQTDLGLSEPIPLVAGELRADKNPTFNSNVVAKLVDSIPKCLIASSQSLGTFADQWNLHFNQAGNREMGYRMAKQMLTLIDVTNIISKRNRFINPESMRINNLKATVFSLDGKTVLNNAKNNGTLNRAVLPGNVYIVRNSKNSGAIKLLLAPGK